MLKFDTDRSAQIEMLVPITLGLLDPTAEPTLEVQNGTSIVGDAITAGGVAGNAMDGYAKHPLTVDTDTEPADLITGTDSDMSGANNWGAGGAATETPNYDSGDEGYEDTLRIEAGDAANERAELTLVGGALTSSKKYILELDYKFINVRDIANDVNVNLATNGVSQTVGTLDYTKPGYWVHFRIEFVTTAAHTILRVYVNGNSGHADNEVLVTNVTLRESGWRIDVALDQLADIDAFVLDGHNLRKCYSASLQDILRLFYHTSDAFASATELVPTEIISGYLGEKRPFLNFDGVTSKVTVGDGGVIQNIFNGGGSIRAIIYPRSDGQSSTGRIIDKGASSIGWMWFVATESGGYTKVFFYRYFSGSTAYWASGFVIPLDEPSELIFTYDDSDTDNNPILYLNGVETTLTEGAAPSGNPTSDIGNDLIIGNRSAGDRTFDGWIMMPQLYNRELSATEAAAIYADPFGLIDDADKWVPPRRNMISEPGAEATISALNLVSLAGTRGTVSRDNGEAHSGSWSNLYTGDGVNNGEHYGYFDLTDTATEYGLVDGADYYFELWVKIPAGNTEIIDLALVVFDGASNELDSTTTLGSWIRLSGSFTYVQGTTTAIRVVDTTTQITAETFYMDDFVLYRKGLQLNGTFCTDASNWSADGAATLTGAYDSGDSGHAETLRIEAGDASGEGARQTRALTDGKRYRISFDYKTISDNGQNHRIRLSDGALTTHYYTESFATSATWENFSTELTEDDFTTDGEWSDVDWIRIQCAASGGAATDELLIDNFLIEQIGCIVEYRPEGIDSDDGKWHPSARRDDQGANDYPVVTEDSLIGTISGCEYHDVPDGSNELSVIKFTEFTSKYLYIEADALGFQADADGKIGLAAWCKSVTLNLSAASGQMGYGGVILKQTDEGNVLAEKRHDRRPAWTLTPETFSEDDWETLQNLLDKIEGNLFPVWICTNPSADEPIWWRCRLQRDPAWTRQTAKDPWSAPLNLIAENN